jgi:hypothetical protein
MNASCGHAVSTPTPSSAVSLAGDDCPCFVSAERRALARFTPLGAAKVGG